MRCIVGHFGGGLREIRGVLWGYRVNLLWAAHTCIGVMLFGLALFIDAVDVF